MNIIEELRKEFPHGHPKFTELSVEEMELHSSKNYDYAYGGDPLGNFYRRATIMGLYPGLDQDDPAVVCLKDLLKQLDAALWMKSQKHEAKCEGIDKRLMDVSVYAKLAIICEYEREEKSESV